MENKNAEVRLAGRWQLNRKFTVTATEEKNLMIFRNQDYIVEFQAGGVMTEAGDNEVSTTTYSYEPATKTIRIQQSGRRRQPSFISGEKDMQFRIIPLNDHEMYFMSPPSIDDSGEFEIILLERI